MHSTILACRALRILKLNHYPFIEFGEDLSSDLRGQDLVRKAFEALASTQEPIGTWRHYRPLFVYSNVGNAYCYVYESFTYLLKAVLAKFEEQEFLEDVIRGFIDRLRGLREYAEKTQVQASASNKRDIIAWSSGHRPKESKPEGWATASVFSYLQAYRRVLGILARRDALRSLPRIVSLEDKLTERGDTWLPPKGKRTVAEDLTSLFVNPVLAAPVPDLSEPDDQPIQEWQARSAILFGPPGTSKTTLVRSIAAKLDWKYVELHSSHFVAEGIQAIQSTADRIFGQLMELDHAVVLFDEPDELVRDREGTADAFGRFLTTSMLPKLAELWKQQRIMFFVATNHVRYFDAAIVRSERFDVLVFVPPPSFDKKIEKLKKCLPGGTEITVKQDEIEAALYQLSGVVDKDLPPESQRAKFLLLRWDQIDELAYRLSSGRPPDKPLMVDSERLSDALTKIADHRLSSVQTYRDYIDASRHAGRDFQRRRVYRVLGLPDSAALPKGWSRNETGVWLKCDSEDYPNSVPGYAIGSAGPGEVRIAPAADKLAE